MKKSNGSGSVFQRKDGRWVAQVYNPDTGRKVTKYFKKQDQAQRALRDLLNQIDQGVVVVTNAETLADFASDWLAKAAGNRRKANTLNAYESRFNLYINPLLGTKRWNAIRVADIEVLLVALKSRGLSQDSLRGVKNALSALYSDAMRNMLCSHNPARFAQVPRVPKSAQRPLPATKQVQELVARAGDLEVGHPLEIGRFLRLLAFTGARFGELLAMKWSDIDEVNGVWTVQRTTTQSRERKQVVGDTTKTGNTRIVLLSRSALNDLRKQRRDVKARELAAGVWTETDWVFPGDHGQLRDGGNVRRSIRRLLPFWKFRLHDLRAWFINYSLEAGGVSDVQVARYVGHAKTSMTKDVYGRRMDEGVLRIVKGIDSALG